MDRRLQIIIAIIIAIFISGFMRYMVYNFTGWKSFSMKGGENFQLGEISASDVSKLKFKKCVYKITGVDGSKKQHIVTSVLNGMVKAYKGNTNNMYKFKLDDPGLDAYSFLIPGFNDNDNHPDPLIWVNNLPSENISLTGYYKLLN
jgi:hypothetical protein